MGMAAPFDEGRRNEITYKLKEGAQMYASQVGMKKVSIDCLVNYAGISKGAFYKFFSSKDELFLEIVEDWHTEIYSTALCILTENNDITQKKKASTALYEAFRIMDDKKIIEFIKNDLVQLLDNIKETEIFHRYHGDDIHIKEVIKFSGIKLLVTDDEAVGIIKNLAYTLFNSHAKGYWHSQKILINAICDFIVK